MNVDALSALMRGLSFIAMFQAVGAAIFLLLLGRRLVATSSVVRRICLASASAAIVLVGFHYGLEAARMAGALAGAFDPSLQQLVMESSTGSAWMLRTAGLALIAIGMVRPSERMIVLSASGGLIVVLSFPFTGHTADHPYRPWLATLLTVHLLVAAFWFGSLAPLHVVSRKESTAVAASIVDLFSRVAVWAVPTILVVGALLTVALVDRWAVFAEGYGVLLLMKFAGFMALMVLASLNKWRYGPALVTKQGAARLFQRTVAIEYVAICAVLLVTSVMTTFFSPDD